MISERRSQTARDNGRKSKGPKTPRGKSISSGNATTHGLHAKSLLLDQESTARFHQVVTAIHLEYGPETASEIAAVETMAFARWRQLRLWTLEQCTLNSSIREARPRPAASHGSPDENDSVADNPCTRAAHAWVSLGDNSNALHLFARYEALYERQFARALGRLEAIRRYRKTKNAERTQEVFENKRSAPDLEPGK